MFVLFAFKNPGHICFLYYPPSLGRDPWLFFEGGVWERGVRDTSIFNLFCVLVVYGTRTARAQTQQHHTHTQRHVSTHSCMGLMLTLVSGWHKPARTARFIGWRMRQPGQSNSECKKTCPPCCLLLLATIATVMNPTTQAQQVNSLPRLCKSSYLDVLMLFCRRLACFYHFKRNKSKLPGLSPLLLLFAVVVADRFQSLLLLRFPFVFIIFLRRR